MLSRLLSMVVLLGFILPPQSPELPTTNPNTEYKLYLPLSVNTYPYVEAFISGFTHSGATWWKKNCVYGYTTALTPSAVYSVTLAIDVGMCTYYDDCYFYTDYLSPTLGASLPNQKNPFSHCVGTLVTEGYAPRSVKVFSVSLTPPGGRVTYPLTIISWKKKDTESGTSIFGTVRNDRGHHLEDIRVVGILSEGLESICDSGAYEANPETTTLNPGEKADFTISQCTEGVSEISAQGVAEP